MSITDRQPDDRRKARRPRTVFLDPAVLDTALAGNGHRSAMRTHTPRVANIDDLAAGVRANVRDAARAVLAWLSAVTTHDAGVDLNAVLRRCLRPGADVTRLNCAALAEEILRHTGVELSPKRVRTAIQSLRRAPLHDTTERDESPTPNLHETFDALAGRLRANFEALTATCGDASGRGDGQEVRRELGTEILAAVRCAVGRVITHGFGEGIPDQVNLDELTGRYRQYIRTPLQRESHGVAQDLRRLLVTLTDHDATAEADMRLVMDGARVVCDLLSPDSLAGVLARLNVLVAGRSLIDTPVYVSQMEALAVRAVALHDDASTRSYLNWSRRLPENARVPSALRVASYCRNNAATRVLERIHLGLLDARDSLPGARRNIAAMRTDDPGFQLLRVTQAIEATVVAGVHDDAAIAEDFFRGQGEAKTIALLGDLMRYDNCPDLVAAVRRLAESVWPGATHRYIRV